jgi:tRNA A-37 threonylcarbamoyl transferase component Bud32/Flp pilus assembly protein TadD
VTGQLVGIPAASETQGSSLLNQDNFGELTKQSITAPVPVGKLPPAAVNTVDRNVPNALPAANMTPVETVASDEVTEICTGECSAATAEAAANGSFATSDHATVNGRVVWSSDANSSLGAASPGAEHARRQAVLLAESGDHAGAMAVAQNALARHPDDPVLQTFVKSMQHGDSAVKTLKDRAQELIAGLRGDAGQAPPAGAAILAGMPFSSLGASAAGNARPLSPAALSAAGLGAKDGGLRLSSPMTRDAATKLAMRDFPGAQSLLDRRLAENPSDEPALRLRAFAFRQMKRYEPSAKDAAAALTLAPWDARAHRLLIDDKVSMSQSAEALEEADRALRETPNDPQLLVARAGVWESLGNREKELADLKQAASLDAQFDQLYNQTVAAGAAPVARHPRSGLVWLGAVGTALLFFSFALFRKRGDSSVRLAMRGEDHEVLARGARPEAAPAGFRIVKTLGQGGMGVVYEAVDLGLQRTVALKKLRAEIADSPRERARFLKEARTVAGLKHPNIVEIHAIHEDAEGLFLVFEKINGESLHERLGQGALRPAEAVGYLRQVAAALDYAHSSGIVHQDLKPANVMVAGSAAKVMDFGIARRVQETMSTLSKVEVAGTPAYMAPEQERGGAVGPAADVFALGACAYELLTGRTPFPNGGMMMKASKLYRPASEVDPSLPKAADAAIARALEPEPGARWPSAASFVEALGRSLA